jgi:inosine triphosphate pyrophosphatase
MRIFSCSSVLARRSPSLLLLLSLLLSSLLLTGTHGFAQPNKSNGKSNPNRVPEGEEPFRQLKITFVTGNAMKATEVISILASKGVTRCPDYDSNLTQQQQHSLVDLQVLTVDLPEIQEVDTMAIAKDKALLAAQLCNGPCLVEDTSLEFTALGGMPGPYIKWFQDTLQSTGLYNILAAYEDKSATAVCTLAFCPAPHADPVLFTGTCRGTIVAPVEGRGFGWDSIFVPDDESEVPFSQMTLESKCRLSHRGKAVRQWADWLGQNQAALWERQEGKQVVGHQGLQFSGVFVEDVRDPSKESESV